MRMEPRWLRRGLSVTAALGCATAAAVVTGGGPIRVQAATLGCGETINVTTTLTADVGPCPSPGSSVTTTPGSEAAVVAGIKIGADNITLNLNGHHILGCNPAVSSAGAVSGVSAACASPVVSPAVNQGNPAGSDASIGSSVTGSGVGILVVNHTGVTITDSTTTSSSFGGGSVENFDAGIEFSGGSGNSVSNIAVRNNVTNVASACCWGEGIGMWNSSNNTIADNLVTGNGPYGGIAVYSFSQLQLPGPTTSTGNVIGKSTGTSPLNGGNQVDDSAPLPNGTTYQSDGIRIEPGVTSTTVEHNTVSGSSLEGIAVFADATGTKVLNNRVSANGFGPLQLVKAGGASQRMGDGIRVFARANSATVTGNTVCGNAGNGIRVDSTGDTVSSNTSGTGSGCAKNDQGIDPKPATPKVATGSLPSPSAIGPVTLSHDYADLYDGTAGPTDGATTNCGSNVWTGNAAGPNKYAANPVPGSLVLNDSYNNACTIRP